MILFGNGRGMAEPYHDGKAYWLVDTLDRERDGRNGRWYRWKGWFGAQLQSFQWTHPRAGERRRLNGRVYRVFDSRRRWLRVEVTWRLVGLPERPLDDANVMLRAVREELDLL